MANTSLCCNESRPMHGLGTCRPLHLSITLLKMDACSLERHPQLWSLVEDRGPGQVAFPLTEGHGTAKSPQVRLGSRHHCGGFFWGFSNKSRNVYAIDQPESLGRKPGLATPWQESASGLISFSGIFYALDIGSPRGRQLPGPPESSHASRISSWLIFWTPPSNIASVIRGLHHSTFFWWRPSKLAADAKYGGARDRSSAAHVARMCW